MDNEVVIHVRSKDETDPGFNSARAKAKALDKDAIIHVKAEDNTDPGFDSVRRKAKAVGDDVAKGMGESGKKAGKSLGEGMVGSFGGVSPQLIQAGAALGIALAPQLGATIAGAVVGGAGFTGVIGGLALAAQDSRVQTSAKTLADQVGMNLKGAAVSFVPATLESLDKIKLAWRGLVPEIQSIFINSARFMGPLTDGLVTMVERVVQGVDKAVQRAEPVMTAFGGLAAEVGDAIGDVFEDLADNAEEGASAVDDLGQSLGNLIRFTGEVAGGLAEVKGKLDEFDGWVDETGRPWVENNSALAKSLRDVGIELDLTADGYQKGSEAANLYREGVIGAAGSANDYENHLKNLNKVQEESISATERHTEALQTLAAEMKSQTDPLFNLLDLQVKVAKAQSDYNKAVEESGENSPKAREALLKMGRSAFDLNTALGGAAEGFDGSLTPAMRTALRNAGLTKVQMDQLEKQLKEAHAAAVAWEGSFQQTFRVREIITRTGERTYGGGGGRQQPIGDRGASGKIKGAASGGMSSSLTWVGEDGPELLDLPPGSQIHSNPDSRRMAVGSDGASMGGPTVINLQIDGTTIATAVLPPLQQLNRNDYAGDVTRMFPATR